MYPLCIHQRWTTCNTLNFFNHYHAIALTDKDLCLMSAVLWLPAPWQILLGMTFICTDNQNIVNNVDTLLRWEWKGYVWSASQKQQNMNTHYLMSLTNIKHLGNTRIITSSVEGREWASQRNLVFFKQKKVSKQHRVRVDLSNTNKQALISVLGINRKIIPWHPKYMLLGPVSFPSWQVRFLDGYLYSSKIFW